ncbi:MAG TPA: sensor domain-containing diguanylate cyclase [Candidatus Binatia bacterium]|nr:sensor domain-containing diguanylate cyclase [Candidatus Binatia bacterium]
MEIASATAGAEDLDTVLEKIAESLRRLFPVDGAALGLVEGDSIMVREVLKPGEQEPRDPERLPADASHLMGWVIRNDKPMWRNDVTAEMRFAESVKQKNLRSDMTIPLRARGRVMGAFRVACSRRHAFDPEDFEVLKRCADMTAVAVETQRLLLATKRLAELDGVTGVFNHRHFRTLLEHEVDRARRLERPVALVMIDIDNFKRFNDTYGHQAGDEVLRHVAQLAARVLRRSDAVARYGGEEFMLVFPHTDYGLLKTICERIVRAFQETRHDVGVKRDLSVTVSIGMATHNDGRRFRSVEDLLKAADKALYTAKLQGRNRSVPFDLVASSQLAYM